MIRKFFPTLLLISPCFAQEELPPPNIGSLRESVERLNRLEIEAMQEEILQLCNEERAKEGLDPLVADPCLTNSIQSWVEYQGSRGTMNHQDLGEVMRECDLNSVAENLAVGQSSARSVVDSWMNSPGHRANILGDYTIAGVGYEPRGQKTVRIGWRTYRINGKYYGMVFGSRFASPPGGGWRPPWWGRMRLESQPTRKSNCCAKTK